mmetsp:Transcript_15229/g.32537  ORF Transcript_15229/g.32537 Transcript_15229/m.32537 type:complete len:256 (-) Transcript_15229:48-815(-)
MRTSKALDLDLDSSSGPEPSSGWSWSRKKRSRAMPRTAGYAPTTASASRSPGYSVSRISRLMQGRILRCVERVACGTPASTSRSKSDRSRLCPRRASTVSSYTCTLGRSCLWSPMSTSCCERGESAASTCASSTSAASSTTSTRAPSWRSTRCTMAAPDVVMPTTEALRMTSSDIWSRTSLSSWRALANDAMSDRSSASRTSRVSARTCFTNRFRSTGLSSQGLSATTSSSSASGRSVVCSGAASPRGMFTSSSP